MIVIKLFLICKLILVSLSYYGLNLKRLINNENILKIEVEDVFYGIIFFYIISIIFNFFVPIYYEISLFIIFFGLVMFLCEIKKIKININFFISLLIIFTLVALYIYKPLLYDSKLYHFQGIEWIKNNKIVFGLTNINYRLGQAPLNWNVSSLLSVFPSEKNFDLFNIIIFFVFFYIIYKSFDKKQKKINNYFIIIFFLLIFFQQLKYYDLWSIFNSISSPDTDISSGIFLTLGIYFFLKNLENEINTNLSLLTSLLLFIAIAIKVTSYVAILIHLLFFYFLFKKNKKIFLKVFSINSILYFIFIIKNFINSGCFIFPLEFTCVEPFWGIQIDSSNNNYSLKFQIP